MWGILFFSPFLLTSSSKSTAITESILQPPVTSRFEGVSGSFQPALHLIDDGLMGWQRRVGLVDREGGGKKDTNALRSLGPTPVFGSNISIQLGGSVVHATWSLIWLAILVQRPKYRGYVEEGVGNYMEKHDIDCNPIIRPKITDDNPRW